MLLAFLVDVESVVPSMRTARLFGARVIGASSVHPLPLSDEADDCVPLPFIADDGFDDALRHVIRTYGVTRLVTIHTAVWAYLARLARRDALVREVFGGLHPVQRQQEDFADSHAWAQRQAVDDLAPSLGTPTRHVAPRCRYLSTPRCIAAFCVPMGKVTWPSSRRSVPSPGSLLRAISSSWACSSAVRRTPSDDLRMLTASAPPWAWMPGGVRVRPIRPRRIGDALLVRGTGIHRVISCGDSPLRFTLIRGRHGRDR